MGFHLNWFDAVAKAAVGESIEGGLLRWINFVGEMVEIGAGVFDAGNRAKSENINHGGRRDCGEGVGFGYLG